MKEYSKGIYVKFKPEEVEILHNRMKEAGVQNMSVLLVEHNLKSIKIGKSRKKKYQNLQVMTSPRP